MRSGWLLLIAGLAACGGESTGVVIRVHAPPAGTPQPDHVRLLIGGAELNDHAPISVSPEVSATSADLATVRLRRGAEAWLRDPDDAQSTLPISASEPATFLFKPSPDGAELGAVIAVGYAGDVPLQGPRSVAAVFHPAFIDGEVYVYDLHLQPAADPSAAVENRTAPDQLQIWGAQQECVYFRTTGATGSDHVEAFLIGSDTDRDCDGLDNADPRECMNSTHLGTRLPLAKDLACSIHDTIPVASSTDLRPVCTLGGPPCMDDAPAPSGTCSPSRYCAPDVVCAICATEGPDCVYELPDSAASSTSIECEVATRGTDVGGVMGYELCPGTISEALPLRPAPIPDELQCDRSAIRNRDQVFASALEDTDPNTPDTWKYDVDVDAGCGLTLVVSGEDTTLSSTQGFKTLTGLLAIELSRAGSAGANRDLAIPIRFRLRAVMTCPERPTCRLVQTADADDVALPECLRAAPPRIE